MHLDPFMKFLGFEGGITAPGQARLTRLLIIANTKRPFLRRPAARRLCLP
jgi:hypothetical protein